MIKLDFVKGKTTDEAYNIGNGTTTDRDVNHGTKVIKDIVDIWAVKGYIVVSADSHFASVKYAR